jgi:hypothetical protein
MRSARSSVAACCLISTLLVESVGHCEPPPARADTGRSGSSVPGIVLLVIGGAALAAGSAILVYGATQDAEEPAAQPQDPGVETGRGWNTSPESAAPAAPEPFDGTPYDMGAALLGGGAIALAVGVALLATSGESDRSRSEARVRPARGGLRLSF